MKKREWGNMTKKRKTTHVRIYSDDKEEINMRFPKVKIADFFHISVKTNALLQMEASLRKNAKKKKK
jgi:hypothetical protein